MLTQMRVLSQNWIGRSIMAVVLGFIIISFAVWGIGDRFSHFNASEIARVGSQRISVDEFRHLFQNQLSQIQQKQKRAFTNEEARRAGLDRQVLARLVNDTTLDQEAARLGLAVSDAAVAQSIMKDDVFKGPTGQFDRMRFAAIMQDSGLTEQRYVREQRGLILRKDLGEAIIAGLAVPKTLEAQIHRFQSEVRDIDFFTLPAGAAGQVGTPSAADLKTFYDKHAFQYQAPEYRKLSVLSIVPADLGKTIEIGTEAIQKRYDEQKARFVLPEKRTAEQLVFADAKAADAAKAKLAGGMSFDKLAIAEKKSPSDITLGTVKKSDLLDPAVADAVFALPDGGTSAPVKTAFGNVLLHVSKIEPKRQQTLAEVSGVIKDDIAKSRAAEMRDKIENERTAGKTLAEAAAKVGLKVRTIEAVDAEGRDKAHQPVEGLVDGPTLLKAAFRTDVGSDTDMIPTAGGGDVWFEVNTIDAAHQLPLDSVKPQVESAWRRAETERRLGAESDKLVATIDGGKTLEAAAASVGKPPLTKATNISRRGGVNLGPAVIRAMFGVPVGKAGTASGLNGERVVFKVTAARVPPLEAGNAELTKLIGQVKEGYENDIIAQYLAELQREMGVLVNQRALQSAVGSNDAGS